MSDTPRTNAQMKFPALRGELWAVNIDFARTLERELTVERQRADRAEAEAKILKDEIDEIHATGGCSYIRLINTEKARDALAAKAAELEEQVATWITSDKRFKELTALRAERDAVTALAKP